MQQQLYLDIFQRYYQRGLAAHRKGEAPEARKALLKAAEVLFKLAAASSGELREARKAKAQKILELAKSIDPSAPAAGEKQKAPAGGDAAAADEQAGKRWIVTHQPDVRMDDVAGLEEVKALILKRVIYPFQHPEITKKYRKQAGGGVLLYGPPGTGKTMIAKAIAAEVDATFFAVKCSDIMSKWVGEAERNLKDLFEATRGSPRAVVFLDETEAIVAKRGGDSTVMNRVIPEFLAQVDGIQGQHGGLLLLGATNRPWDMDEAALRPGRFGELIFIPLPDEPARRQIIGAALKDIPLAEEIDLASLAEASAGYSGADCVAICESAKDGPYEREINTGIGQRLEAEDFDRALKHIRPSVTQAQLNRYRRFQETRQ